MVNLEQIAAEWGNDPGKVSVDIFAASMPLELFNVDSFWMKVIEQADDEVSLAAAVSTLETYRRLGGNVPAYVVALERWNEDEHVQGVLYAGHVDGKSFEEVDFDSQVDNAYATYGFWLLDYLSHCQEAGLPTLTDITKIDQTLYGQTPVMANSGLVLVDLELHHDFDHSGFQLEIFENDYLRLYEERRGSIHEGLRAKVEEVAQLHY